MEDTRTIEIKLPGDDFPRLDIDYHENLVTLHPRNPHTGKLIQNAVVLLESAAEVAAVIEGLYVASERTWPTLQGVVGNERVEALEDYILGTARECNCGHSAEGCTGKPIAIWFDPNGEGTSVWVLCQACLATCTAPGAVRLQQEAPCLP